MNSCETSITFGPIGRREVVAGIAGGMLTGTLGPGRSALAQPPVRGGTFTIGLANDAKTYDPIGRDANARGYSRKHIVEAPERSLRRLRTGYIDIYQTHIWDPAANLEEMTEAFDHLVQAGKVLHVGITGMPFWRFATAYFHAERNGLARFASVQNHYNLLWRKDERELLPFCQARGIGPDGARLAPVVGPTLLTSRRSE